MNVEPSLVNVHSSQPMNRTVPTKTFHVFSPSAARSCQVCKIYGRGGGLCCNFAQNISVLPPVEVIQHLLKYAI